MKLNKIKNHLLEDNTSDFRFIPFGCVFVYISALLLSEFFLGSYAVVGNYFRIHPMPYFVDLEILLCGIDAIREGANPYNAICFEGEAYFNYPYAWGVLAIIPFFTVSNLIYIGIGLLILFFTALYFFIGKINFLSAVVYTLIFLSPAVMLGVERGNSDVIIFLMLFLVPIVFKKSKFISAILIFITSLLKIFPIGAIICILLATRNKILKSFWITSSIVLAFVCYLILMKDNILLVSQKTPRPYKEASYGLGSVPSFLIEHFEINSSSKVKVFLLFIVVFTFVFIVFFRYLDKKISPPLVQADQKGISYAMGSGIFITTCLIGYNWEYRLIFLIFTIPQILYWLKDYKFMSKSLLILYFIVLWSSLIIPITSLVIPSSLAYFINYLSTIFLFYIHVYIFIKFFRIYFENTVLYKTLFTKT